MKERYLENSITYNCFKYDKMAFVAGPRQAGKTTLAKNLRKNFSKAKYFNWDDREFRKIWGKSLSVWLRENLNLNNKKSLIILDEIHKAKLWKRDLKGIFDIFNKSLDIIVTGSARLNVYKKGSDSLLGRYFLYRLHPFSLGELTKNDSVQPAELINSLRIKTKPSTKNRKILEQLFEFGGFPEPYLNANKNFHRIWQRGRVEKVIREDLRDISRIPELSQIEILVSLLPETISSPLSVRALSEDLEVAYTTVARWLKYLEQLYYCYTLKLFQKIRRSLKERI
ncbi:MAG: AAA family ATPase [Bdellovibrionota bacterium]